MISNSGDMVNFVCKPPYSKIVLTVAMETMHFFIVQLSLSLRTKILCISGVPMNDLTPMKNCPGGCKVGQISSRGISYAAHIIDCITVKKSHYENVPMYYTNFS